MNDNLSTQLFFSGNGNICEGINTFRLNLVTGYISSIKQYHNPLNFKSLSIPASYATDNSIL